MEEEKRIGELKVIRAERFPQQAGACSVRIQGMARAYGISLEDEFDLHDGLDCRYILIQEGVYPIATCRLYPLNEREMMIGRVVVLPEYRGRGLGRRVLEEAEAWIRDEGYETAVLESRDITIPFYEKLGYKADSSRIVEGPTFTCTHMEKRLCEKGTAGWRAGDGCLVQDTPRYRLTVYGEGIEADWGKRFDRAGNDGELTALLIEKNLRFAAMESCTSGLLASTISDYSGASAILKGSAVTYSNEAKIMAGVPVEVIDTFGVYSAETAKAMAGVIRKTFDAAVSAGVTGSFSNVDPANPDSVAGEIYMAFETERSRMHGKLIWKNLDCSRREMKQRTVDVLVRMLTALVKD